MKPVPAIVSTHHKRRIPTTPSVDGNTYNYYEEDYIKDVPANVWPVCMGADKLLVQYEDGRLGAVRLHDIQLDIIVSNHCPHCDPELLIPIRECGPNSIRLTHAYGELGGAWHIAVNIELSDGSFIQEDKEIHKVMFTEPISYCPKCGRELV